MRPHPRANRIVYRQIQRSAAGALAATVAMLAGCGGSSSSTPMPASPAANAQLVESTAANTAVVPSAATMATSASVWTAQSVVAGATMTISGNSASATVACATGGTATFTVTAPTPATLANGQFDAGENYTIQFHSCQGAAGGPVVTGTLGLDVIAANTGNLTVQTSTDSLVVALPNGTVTLDGSSTLVQTVTTSGTTVTTTDHWTTPSYRVTTAFNGRSDVFTLSNVDITATTTVVGGVLVGTTYDGTMTLSASLPVGTFVITIATQGATNYDANGTPTLGTWTITLQTDAITLTIAGSVATIGVDYGSLGVIDKTYSYPISTLDRAAG